MRHIIGWRVIGLALLISVLLAACMPASPATDIHSSDP